MNYQDLVWIPALKDNERSPEPHTPGRSRIAGALGRTDDYLAFVRLIWWTSVFGRIVQFLGSILFFSVCALLFEFLVFVKILREEKFISSQFTASSKVSIKRRNLSVIN